jgi:predicted dehydrogenase
MGLASGLWGAAQSRARIKVGVIGCGSVSGSYLPVMAASPHIELVSACDIIVSRAEERARRFDIPHVFPRIDKMLAGPHFDLLVDLTSMPAHYPINRKGLEGLSAHDPRLWIHIR